MTPTLAENAIVIHPGRTISGAVDSSLNLYGKISDKHTFLELRSFSPKQSMERGPTGVVLQGDKCSKFLKLFLPLQSTVPVLCTRTYRTNTY